MIDLNEKEVEVLHKFISKRADEMRRKASSYREAGDKCLARLIDTECKKIDPIINKITVAIQK